jgi:hypothetical protein
MNHWNILGIAPTTDEREIKSAFAKKLKALDQELNPKEVQTLREAYERAKQYRLHEQYSYPDEEYQESDEDDSEVPVDTFTGLQTSSVNETLSRFQTPEQDYQSKPSQFDPHEVSNHILDKWTASGSTEASLTLRQVCSELTPSQKWYLDEVIFEHIFQATVKDAEEKDRPYPFDFISTCIKEFRWDSIQPEESESSNNADKVQFLDRFHARKKYLSLVDEADGHSKTSWSRRRYLRKLLLRDKSWFFDFGGYQNFLSSLQEKSPELFLYEKHLLDKPKSGYVFQWWHLWYFPIVIVLAEATVRYWEVASLCAINFTLLALVLLYNKGSIPALIGKGAESPQASILTNGYRLIVTIQANFDHFINRIPILKNRAFMTKLLFIAMIPSYILLIFFAFKMFFGSN